MSAAQTVSATPSAPRALKIGLWVAQGLLCLTFGMAGVAKLSTPIPQLSSMIAWTGDTPEAFVRFIGLVDLAGGIGILLPALTRIQPRLTVLAALGITVLQVLAIAFHVSRGEFSLLPLNGVLLSLAVFVLWGRSRKAPVLPR